VPSAFESLINDTARGVISRSEKWGFNQAVRDAVGEVRKNVQNLQTGRSSPRTSLIGPGHRSSRSSEVSENIAANVLRKMTALEDRNKHLAKMLEAAVADLWNLEKEAADKKTMTEDGLQALSLAAAKVQFVQVFLQDSTLPLPQEENQKSSATDQQANEEKRETAAQYQQSANLQAHEHSIASPDPSAKRPHSLAPSPIPVSVMPMPTGSPPPSLPTTSVSAHHASATAPSITKAPTNFHPEKPTNTSRPRIEQSNYSWMLGQAHEDSSNFVRASPFAPA
jgi:TBC1 domain family protein 5